MTKGFMEVGKHSFTNAQSGLMPCGRECMQSLNTQCISGLEKVQHQNFLA